MKKVCIIGSGIAGLYAAYILKKKDYDVTIFEKNDRIGGRIKTIMFDGINVVSGAGIGRDVDVLLKKLCLDIKAETHPFQAKTTYYKINPKFSVLDKIKELKEANLQTNGTFKEVALPYLKKNQYNQLVSYIGETDYENEDYHDVIDDYGFDKSFSSGFPAFSINWDNFLSIFHSLLKENIVFNKNITKISKSKNGFLVNNKYFDKVIVATTISNTKTILASLLKNNNHILKHYDNIACQTFARVYAKLDKPLDFNNFRTVITKNPFQKMIEMNKNKNIYMISYSDNKQADFWKQNEDNLSETIETQLKKQLQVTVKVEKSELCYWKCGTHYCLPLDNTTFETRDDFLKTVQNPSKNLYVVGEAFSRNHGWCEGALESVQNIFRKSK
jgi:protoporphyrinogen oxidase